MAPCVAGFKRLGVIFAVATLSASALALAGPPTARAQDLPPSFTAPLSPENVVPGPGQPDAYDSGANFYETDNPGEICWYFDYGVITGATSAGIYQGAAGTTGPLLVDLPHTWNYDTCIDIGASLVDDMAANAGAYYLQVNTVDYPDGAARGQIELIVPLVSVFVDTWLCSRDTKFGPQGNWRDRCGIVALPGQGYEAMLGYTTVRFAGHFNIDYRVQGPAGFDQTIANAENMGGAGYYDPETLISYSNRWSYEWYVRAGAVTVDPLVPIAGARLAFIEVYTSMGDPIDHVLGPRGHVAMDLVGHEMDVAMVNYYYTAPPRLTPPAELAPVVEIGDGATGRKGEIPLTVKYGAIERGSKPISYEVQVQRDGGSFHKVYKGTSPVATVGEMPGHSYVFRVRATDSYGASSGWVVGAQIVLDPTP